MQRHAAHSRFRRGVGLAAVAAAMLATLVRAAEPEPSATALQVVEYADDGAATTIRGRVLVTAADGGILLETPDSQLVAVKPEALVSRVDAGRSFTYLDADQLGALLIEELGPGFEILRTRRYVIATNAGDDYARWCGGLLERLHTAFLGYWKRAGLELHEPEHPLAAIVFATPEEFAAYATADAGAALAQSQGYYSIRTNRIVLMDLTRQGGQPGPRTEGELQRRLESQVANLSTVVHEATHQIAFNSGMHVRYADNPMWLAEGMAMYFEAPDLRSTTGWRTIGKVHAGRLQQFQQYAAMRRGADSLASLVMSDDRFRDPATAPDAYAESWALTYFLIRRRRGQYVAWLQLQARRPQLVWDRPEQREQAFLAAFETDWPSLERDFAQFMRPLLSR